MLVTHSCISAGESAARCSTCPRPMEAFGRTRLSSASRAAAPADLGPPVLEKWPTLKWFSCLDAPTTSTAQSCSITAPHFLLLSSPCTADGSK